MTFLCKIEDRSSERLRASSGLPAIDSTQTPSASVLALDLAREPWAFREVGTDSWLPAHVPGCVHTDLRRAGKISDPFWGTNELGLQWIEESDWEYRCTFRTPPELNKFATVELAADGLDTIAMVLLNGQQIAATENMFIGYRWPVKAMLRDGANELRIVFTSAMRHIRATRLEHRPSEKNDPVGRSTVVRKQACQFGWDWGPRFVTAGIWRGIRLEARRRARLTSVRIEQFHRAGGGVRLAFSPELSASAEYLRFEAVLSLAGVEVGSAVGSTPVIELTKPQLWWPAGQGEQPLYDAVLIARDAQGIEVDRWSGRVGLRTIVLDRHPDKWGESFQFVVNGRPVFLKGANWIPAHAFVAELTRQHCARDLQAAAAANMNCIRVWGGGIYEHDDFYALCDELGLLVWQDFMFACTLAPSDDAFLESVRAEAEYQIKRLRHHACLALWCGNNEIAQLNKPDMVDPAVKAGYEKLFHEMLPECVAQHDGTTAYWPSSEWRGAFGQVGDLAAGENSGDTHYWEVWHSRKPVKSYEKWQFRFCSEFGMQSYCSPETQATFCASDDSNVFGPVMENHQKNRGGNQTILDYVSRRYRFPKSQGDLIWLSQLNQAYCMQVAVEHYRRISPRCMGAIYWQLNDCWPVASWSSIEFNGRWKALHFVARRFFAPALASAHVPGDETAIIGNYRRSDVSEAHLYTIYDNPVPTTAELFWELRTLTGAIVLAGRKAVELRCGESVRQEMLDLAEPISEFGRDHLYLRLGLRTSGGILSEETIFLAPPRFLALPRATIQTSLQMESPTRAVLAFRSSAFQHRVCFDLPGISHQASDNFFELYPDEPKTIEVKLDHTVDATKLLKVLRTQSLVDTYL